MNTKTLTPEMVAKQIKMYGALETDIIAAYDDRLARMPEMYWPGMLSDAQHLMEHGDTEGARQMLNQVKLLMSVEMERKMNKVGK